MTTKLTEIKEMIFQLPKEEINQLIEEVTEIMATKDFMQLADTGFSEWNNPEEDIYKDSQIKKKSLRGILQNYANPELMTLESTVWENYVEEKYGDR